jgi:simple sugar transport system substrate-binding protein
MRQDKRPGQDRCGCCGKSALSIAVITHGGPGDAFWDVVKRGAEQAGRDLGVNVEYQGSGKPDEQADLVNAAVSNRVDGIVVSMANPDALSDPIRKAVTANIPIITINSGQARSRELGALAHVGQDDTVAGRAAGNKLAQAGIRRVLCVKHEAANVGLDQRCGGATETLGGKVENLQVDGKNVAEAQNTIASKLQQDKAIDGVLALNPAVAAAAVDAASKAGSKARIATFDLNADVIDGVDAGRILFAVDQQQYLQGYLPVMMLKLYSDNANTVGGGSPVLTGPGFVTKENVTKVRDLTAKGTR